ncbi:MAG: AraC family transcriptional regulator [Lachnospiraceae bacterium]|nr:AraC family transcriptional regulator [Lachnospiraceae bacterium]
MKEHSSCHQAIQSCLDTKSFAIAHLYSDEKPMSMHIHDSYEIYFSISGGKQFLIDNRFYDIRPGDIFFINQFESHYLTQIDQQVHERILLSIYPDFLKNLSTPKTDLDYCFHLRSIPSPHRVRLTEEEQKRFVYFIHRLSSASGYGADITERAVFSELMVFLNKAFHNHGETDAKLEETEHSYHGQVDEILSYINQNIAKPLTIEDLSGHFYLSSSYLCRIFKSTTGMTINKYITAKRITLSKALLAEGLSVSETCEKCGFNDYSNFLKAFTKAVGISPKKYAQFNS